MRSPKLLALLVATGCAPDPGWIDDRFFVRVDDADLYVHAVGNGMSNRFVLFLHGGPGGGSGGYELSPAAPMLHENLVMVYLDQRGAGASEGRTPVEDLTLDLLTSDVSTVMEVIELKYMADRAGTPELWLMGHSWGGMLGPSVLFETDAQERLSGWIEVAGAHDIPKLHADSAQMLLAEAELQLEGNVDEDTREAWQEIQAVARRADPTPRDLDALLELNQAAADATDLIEEVDFQALDGGDLMGWLLGRSTSWATNAAAAPKVAYPLLEESLDRSWSERYRDLEIPTLLISGRYDFVVPPTLAQDVQLRIASERVESVVFDNSAHMPMFSEPTAYAQTVLDFVGSAP